MDIYQQNILDYYRHPRCQKKIHKPSAQSEASNPLCGDRLELYLSVDKGQILQAAWQGEGCVLSLAAVDMLTESLVGKSLDQAAGIDKEWLLKILGVNPTPSRLKCALLSLEALKKALVNN